MIPWMVAIIGFAWIKGNDTHDATGFLAFALVSVIALAVGLGFVALLAWGFYHFLVFAAVPPIYAYWISFAGGFLVAI